MYMKTLKKIMLFCYLMFYYIYLYIVTILAQNSKLYEYITTDELSLVSK